MISPFVETNPCIDEYRDCALGVFLPNGFCIIGLLWVPKHYALQYGIIVLNICFGVWLPED